MSNTLDFWENIKSSTSLLRVPLNYCVLDVFREDSKVFWVNWWCFPREMDCRHFFDTPIGIWSLCMFLPAPSTVLYLQGYCVILIPCFPVWKGFEVLGGFASVTLLTMSGTSPHIDFPYNLAWRYWHRVSLNTE